MSVLKKYAVFGVLLCVACWAHAEKTWHPNLNRFEAAPYLPEVLKQTPALKKNVLALLKSHNQLDDWIVEGFDDGAMVTTPVKPMHASTSVVFTGTFCKPHDCGDTEWSFAYEPKTQALLLVQNNRRLYNTAGKNIQEPLSEILNLSNKLNHIWW